MYHYHYDERAVGWNAYNKGEYLCTFPTQQEAEDFCNFMNQPDNTATLHRVIEALENMKNIDLQGSQMARE